MERVVEQNDFFSSSDFFSPPPPIRRRVNGRWRTRAEYDYGRVERTAPRRTIRVEVKSTRLRWDNHKGLFRVQFKSIKSGLHDELRLAIYTPLGVYIYIHDGVFGLSTNGAATHTKGLACTVWADKGDDWLAALSSIHAKLTGLDSDGNLDTASDTDHETDDEVEDWASDAGEPDDGDGTADEDE